MAGTYDTFCKRCGKITPHTNHRHDCIVCRKAYEAERRKRTAVKARHAEREKIRRANAPTYYEKQRVRLKGLRDRTDPVVKRANGLIHQSRVYGRPTTSTRDEIIAILKAGLDFWGNPLPPENGYVLDHEANGPVIGLIPMWLNSVVTDKALANWDLVDQYARERLRRQASR